jgi:hypothetical protein
MVNTFIPYSSFKKCAKVLDNKRLGKQRVEAKQILNIIEKLKTHDPSTKYLAWSNHPVVLMWKDHIPALKMYYNTIVQEWIERGFRNTMKFYRLPHKIDIPWFMHNEQVLLSFRAALLRKNHAHYSKFFINVPPEYMKRSYVWITMLSCAQIVEMKKGKILRVKDICKKIK